MGRVIELDDGHLLLCFSFSLLLNLQVYSCIKGGRDHAPIFKFVVNFNGEVFEIPNYWNTLRQFELSLERGHLILFYRESLLELLLQESWHGFCFGGVLKPIF